MSITFGKKYLIFILLLILYISQLFMVVPGSLVGGGIYSDSSSITIFGFTYSALVSMALVAYGLIEIFPQILKAKIKRSHLLCLFCLLFFSIFGVLVSSNKSSAVAFLLKLLMPFILYFYFEYCESDDSPEVISKLLLVVNVVLVLQVLVCKAVYGSFSASRYYWYIMEEEFYGFYNSPHPFTAILGLLSIWNFWRISNCDQLGLNLFLLASNFLLIALSGVRTYLLSSVAVAILLLLSSFGNVDTKRLRILAVIIFLICVFSSGLILSYLSETRVSAQFNSTELSSGRFDRWEIDYSYFCQGDLFQRLFGRGFEAVYAANSDLIGYYINSLNFAIDLLIDNGVVGLILICIAYATLLHSIKGRGVPVFKIALFLYLAIGLMLNNLLPYVTVTCTSVLICRAWQSSDVFSSN